MIFTRKPTINVTGQEDYDAAQRLERKRRLAEIEADVGTDKPSRKTYSSRDPRLGAKLSSYRCEQCSTPNSTIRHKPGKHPLQQKFRALLHRANCAVCRSGHTHHDHRVEVR